MMDGKALDPPGCKVGPPGRKYGKRSILQLYNFVIKQYIGNDEMLFPNLQLPVFENKTTWGMDKSIAGHYNLHRVL